MMDQQATFRFHGGPGHSRTSRISKETWQKHEATIRALFPSSTLRELREMMETRHGFKATEKQYIYQFPKWNLQKRVGKQAAPTGPSPPDVSTERDNPRPTDPGGQGGAGRDSPPSPFTTPGAATQYSLSPQYETLQGIPDSRPELHPDAYTPRDYQPVVGGKRSRSIVSLASQVSGRSTRDWNKRSKVWPEASIPSPQAPWTTDFTPSPWASSRAQWENSLHSPGSYGGRGSGIESPWSPVTTVFTSTGISQGPPETPETSGSDSPDEALLPHHGLPLEPRFDDWTTPELHEALEAATQQVFQKTLSDDPRIRVSRRHKLALRLARLAETLLRRSAASWCGAKGTTRQLRGVAEYLQAVGQWTDAFYLYALLLSAAEEENQREPGAGGPSAPWSLGALHRACAAAANTPGQCAMVRTWPAFAPAAFYGYQRFLQHGVCADMYGRAGLPAEAALEAAEARRLLTTATGFGTACVAGVRFGRNADLVAYSYLVRFGTAAGSGDDAEAAPTFADYDRFVHRVWEAPVHGTGAGAGGGADRDDADGRDPLADLRSVLRWCFRAVDPRAATDGDAVFSTFSEIDEANSAVAPAPDDLGPAALDPRALGLFHCLFDRWIQLRDPAPPARRDGAGDDEVWLWTQTQERMGLAPTEFLAILCEMITEAGGGGGGGVAPERSAVSYTAFIEQLDALDALPDAELADRFLAHFCAREALSHRTGLPEASPPSPPPSAPPDDDEAAGAPDSSSAPAAPSAAGPGGAPLDLRATAEDDDVQSRSAGSAVAPSYASSDMSSLRRMAQRARNLVGNPADVADPHEPPSRLLRRSSLAVSELSERFSESMSIASSRPSLWASRSRQRNSGASNEWRPRGG